MTRQVPRSNRVALAWAVCVCCSLLGVSLAILAWWALPSAVTSPAQTPLARLLGETLLVLGFATFAGVGILVGVMLCRRFLSAPEFAKLTEAPPDRDF
jgi:hypothetical protein